LKKGKITGYSAYGRALLAYLIPEKSQYCCIHDTKKGNWLNSVMLIDAGKCPIYKEIMSFGESHVLLHIVICRGKKLKKKVTDR